MDEILGSLKKKTVFDGNFLSCDLEKVLDVYAEKTLILETVSGVAKQYLNGV